jgi:hypothetical protein
MADFDWWELVAQYNSPIFAQLESFVLSVFTMLYQVFIAFFGSQF